MKKTYTLKYRRLTVRFNFNPRKNVCECCGRKGKTDLHHILYEFRTEEVRKNKQLALLNTLEVCFRCHNLCNDICHIWNNKELANKLEELMRKRLVNDKYLIQDCGKYEITINDMAKAVKELKSKGWLK